LIKDYEIEVNYHPKKPNIVADALSHEAHCNYLLIVPLTGEESSIRVLPDLSLYNITLTPLLREDIIAAQKNDEGMAHLRRRLSKVTQRSIASVRMQKEPYDSKINLWCQRKKHSRRRFWMKLIHRDTLFIQ
jgi:hypothetical protein